METNTTVSRTKLILMWGGIMGAVIYLISFIGRTANLDGAPAWGLASFLLSVAVVATCMGLAVRTWRDKGLGGFISFGKAFNTAFLTGLFATVLMCLLTVLVLSFMGDDFKQEMADRKTEEIAKMEDAGQSEEAIEMAEQMFDLFTSLPMILAMIVVMYTIGSAVMALIIAAIYKKEDPNNFGLA
ncbi:MAG: DUF4199 domain-containing protein [Sphingobacteriales bacterium JAD_PAG50586_3]|nr:MAG: DUF4199 domain-containing protein [Sphingobacteriales bacterium JAD_PAG50586_3]